MPFQSEKQRKYLHANHPEIAKRWEKEYATGGISNLFKNRTGFHRGSLRHQKEHDYQAYEDEGNFMKYLMLSGDRAKQSSPENWLYRLLLKDKTRYVPEVEAFETMQKERFMYGDIKEKYEQEHEDNPVMIVFNKIKELLKKKDDGTEGTTRSRLQKDWESYATLKDLLYGASPVLQDKPGSYTGSGRVRDEEETRLKERFMYGDQGKAQGGMITDLTKDPEYRGWKKMYETNPEIGSMHEKHPTFIKFYKKHERDRKKFGGLAGLLYG